MNVAAINEKKLKLLVRQLRTLNTIPAKLRREIVDALMKECDLVRRTDIENLICTSHALTLSGYKAKESLQSLAKRGVIHIYFPCHQGSTSYYDRKEIELVRLKEKRVGGPARTREKLMLLSGQSDTGDSP